MKTSVPKVSKKSTKLIQISLLYQKKILILNPTIKIAENASIKNYYYSVKMMDRSSASFVASINQSELAVAGVAWRTTQKRTALSYPNIKKITQ